MPFYPRLKYTEDEPAKKISEKIRIAEGIVRLREALDLHIHGDDDHEPTGKSSSYLRLATWNIRELDSSKYGNRIKDSNYFIAEILSHFDLIAIQEVRQDLAALKKIMKILGPEWDFIATDVTSGTKGNSERMAFVFNRTKVWFSKVAGELTLTGKDRLTFPETFHVSGDDGLDLKLPPGGDIQHPAKIKTETKKGKLRIKEEVVMDLPPGSEVKLPANSKLVFGTGSPPELRADKTLNLGAGETRTFSNGFSIRIPKERVKAEAMQFARTPFGVMFQAGWLKLMLVTVHIFYGSDTGPKLERRNDEISRLTKAMSDRAKSDNDSDADSFFFLLGDFNILGKGHKTWDSLHENNFKVPEKLKEIPKGSNVKRNMAYDQIAFWTGKSRRRSAAQAVSRVVVRRAGIFDFFKTVFRSGNDDPENIDTKEYTPIMLQMQKDRSKKPVKRAWAYESWRTYQMSDHLPMWIELKIDFSKDYLEKIISKE